MFDRGTSNTKACAVQAVKRYGAKKVVTYTIKAESDVAAWQSMRVTLKEGEGGVWKVGKYWHWLVK